MKYHERARAILRSGLRAPLRLTLFAIAHHANAQDKCFPSIDTLMQETGLDDRTIQRAIRDLVAMEALERDEVVGIRTTYRLHLDKLPPVTPKPVRVRPPRNPRHRVTPANVTPPSERRDSPVTETPPPPSESHPNGSGNGSMNGSAAAPSELEDEPDPVQLVWDAIVELEPLVQTRNGRPRKPQASTIRARIDEDGLEAVLLVVEYVHRRPHLNDFWGPKNKDPGSYLLPKHFPGILLKAKACGLSSVPRKPKLAWSSPSDAAFLEWVENIAAPELLEVEDYAKGWVWWQEHVETDRTDAHAYEHDQCFNAAWDARVELSRQTRTLRLA